LNASVIAIFSSIIFIISAALAFWICRKSASLCQSGASRRSSGSATAFGLRQSSVYTVHVVTTCCRSDENVFVRALQSVHGVRVNINSASQRVKSQLRMELLTHGDSDKWRLDEEKMKSSGGSGGEAVMKRQNWQGGWTDEYCSTSRHVTRLRRLDPLRHRQQRPRDLGTATTTAWLTAWQSRLVDVSSTDWPTLGDDHQPRRSSVYLHRCQPAAPSHCMESCFFIARRSNLSLR